MKNTPKDPRRARWWPDVVLSGRDVALVVLVTGCASDPDGSEPSDGLVQDGALSQDAASDLDVGSPVDAAGADDSALVPDAEIDEGLDAGADPDVGPPDMGPPDMGPPGLPECVPRDPVAGYLCLVDVLAPHDRLNTRGSEAPEFDVVQVSGPRAERCQQNYGYLARGDVANADLDTWMLELADAEGRPYVLGFALPGQAALLDRAPFEAAQQLELSADEDDDGEGGSKSTLVSISRDGQPVLFGSNRNWLPLEIEARWTPVCYDSGFERTELEVELSAEGEQVTLQMGETGRVGGWILTLAEAYDYPDQINFDIDSQMIWGVRE